MYHLTIKDIHRLHLIHLLLCLTNEQLFFFIQTYPFGIFTFITKHLLFTLFRAKPVIPTIRTLWKIAPVLSPSGIYIFSSPKHRKETYCHFLCNIRWIYNTIPLIQVIFFCTFYFSSKGFTSSHEMPAFFNLSFNILFSYSSNLTIFLNESASYASMFKPSTYNSYHFVI